MANQALESYLTTLRVVRMFRSDVGPDEIMKRITHSLWKRIIRSFPDATPSADGIAFGGICLRFELGGGWANGSIRRINQSVARASALFGDLFQGSKSLALVVYDWDISGKELNPSEPPDHLFTLIKGFTFRRSMIDGSVRRRREPWRRMFVESNVCAMNIDGLLRATANNEQGLRPNINQKVYLVDTEAAVAFHMYDDRGCFAWMMDAKKALQLQKTRGKWILK